MLTLIKLKGETVARSKNLRGILAYARKSPVEHVTTAIIEPNGGGLLRVEYENGATVHTTFADHRVLVDWVARRRGWPVRIPSHFSVLARLCAKEA